MAVTSTYINGHLVYKDDIHTHRWYDAWGPAVAKCLEDFVNTPFSAADQLAGWLATLVEGGAGETTAALVAGALNGELLVTTDAADNDGWNGQLLGEAFYFAARYPTYFGCKFRISDATQEDFVAGLVITDTAVIEGGTSDGLYFRKNDGDTTLYLVAEKDSLETAIGLTTVVAATDVTAEYVYSAGVVTAYINGVAVATLADSDPNFPDNEYLTVTLAVQAGEAVVKTANVDYIKAIQVQSL